MGGQIDHLLAQLGTGKWNIFHFIACAYGNILITPHTLGRPFLAPKLDYSCQDEDFLYPPPPWSNASSIPENGTRNECGRYVTSVDGQEEEVWQECSHWDFDNSTFTYTITSEFQLACGFEHLRTAYQSLYQLGCFIGSPLAGFLADKYGRRVVIRVSSIVYIILALGTCWINNFMVILVARFIMGIGHAIILIDTYILAVEMAEPRRRAALGMSIYLVWAASVMAWGGLAYLIRGWSLLQFVASLSSLLFLPMLWFMDESPRWLMVSGRHREALVVLRKAARWNKAQLPPEQELLAFMQNEMTPKPRGTSQRSLKTMVMGYLDGLLVLFKSPVLRRISLCMYVIYGVGSMVYYGLSLSGGDMSDNPFVYMALSGLMEVPAYTITIPIVQRFGRRIPCFFCFAFCGVALFLLAVIPKEHNWLIVTLAMVGKITNTAAITIAFFYSNELFPTEVRSRGIGTASVVSRVGSVVAPYILDFVGVTYAWAPSVVFGVGSILAAGCTLLLPETRGATLPDTVEELHQQAEDQKRRSLRDTRL